jgi:predicted permease
MTVPLDVRYGFRKLNNSVGFTIVAVACLALGICASVTVFSVVDALLLRPFPGVVDQGRIVSMGAKPIVLAGLPGDEFAPLLSYRDFQRYREASHAFTELVAYHTVPVNLAGNGEAQRVTGQVVTTNYFRALGLRSSLGRLFTPDAERKGAQPEAVISQRLWRRTFGSRRQALGSAMILNGAAFVVVGVLPEGFHGTLHGMEADIWVPIEDAPLLVPDLRAGALAGTKAWLLWFFGRLAPGVGIEQAQAEMDHLALRWAASAAANEKPPGLVVYPGLGVWPGHREALKGPLLLLSAIAGLLMLVVCANLGGLLLVKASARQEEIGVRLALGVTRSRLMRQMLSESVTLSLLGGAAGFVLALFAVDVIQGLSLGRFLPPINNVAIGARVVVFTVLLSLGAGALFGLGPALWSTRRRMVPLLRHGGGDGALERGRTRLQEILVVGQVTVSLLLLVSTGLFVRTLWNLRSVDLGFSSRDVTNVRIDLSLRGNRAPGLDFYDRLLDQVGRVANIRAASLTRTVPLGRGGGSRQLGILHPAGWPAAKPYPQVEYDVISPGFFKTLGITLVRGRDFSAMDRQGSPPVLIVDETLARELWPGRDPVGERIALNTGEVCEVVGVVRTIRFWDLGEPRPYFYLAFAQHYFPAMALQVRAVGGPPAAVSAVRAILHKMDPGLAVEMSSFDEEVQDTLSQPRLFSWLSGSVSLTALLVTAIGLYGVLSYAVSRRTREFGIRMALGARASEIIVMVLRRGLVLTLVGLVLGLVTASWATSLYSRLLFEVTPTDPAVFIGVVLLLVLVGLAASSLPAYRATRVDPMAIIRHE